MTRFIHIQRYRSVVLVALAVLFAAFMVIGAPAVMAAKGGVQGKPTKDTSGTTPIDTSGGGGDTGTTPTDTSGGGSGTGTTPTGDNSDTTPTDTNGGGDTNTSSD